MSKGENVFFPLSLGVECHLPKSQGREHIFKQRQCLEGPIGFMTPSG